jgi:acetyl-CoA/propionyl-CoA carboxylase biotin carboxyl carrier protein
MLRRILIANRGEIARRIARTCRRLGVEYVAVCSEADRDAAHLEGAVSVVCLGPAPAISSYLRIDAVVEAARGTGCDGVHPGYGFLSENPDFADAVVGAGLVFVGPDAVTIRSMGNKSAAKALMAAAGVPVLPGTGDATEDLVAIETFVAAFGFPVILKPVAGGGGIGMHVVRTAAELAPAVAAGVRVARANFSDGRLLVERYVVDPRHVEVQVFGDRYGNVVHLFERECSLQRRHQKIIEEAPAIALPDATRRVLFDAAVRGATAIGYVNAGTFEFIIAPDGAPYFLEVNTRLQVEHPVTEAITGVDLVEWQLRVASGEALPLAQPEIVATGHAIEARIYAEDPENGFRPAPGRVTFVAWPATLRVEAAFDRAGTVPPYYDAMVAKLIAHGSSRAEALGLLREGLRQTGLIGLTSNVGFLSGLLATSRVVAGAVDTGLADAFVGAYRPRGRSAAAAACALSLRWRAATGGGGPWSGSVGPFDRAGLDVEAPLGRLSVEATDGMFEARLIGVRDSVLQVRVGDRLIVVSVAPGSGVGSGVVEGLPWIGVDEGSRIEVVIDGWRSVLRSGGLDGAAEGQGGPVARAMISGVVVALPVEAGDVVERGATLAVIEAMKTENRVLAPMAGVVEAVRCALGDPVAMGQELVLLRQAEVVGHAA